MVIHPKDNYYISPELELANLILGLWTGISKSNNSLWIPTTESTPVRGQLIRNYAYKKYLASKEDMRE